MERGIKKNILFYSIDGLDTNCNNNHGNKWTYNQGIYIYIYILLIEYF